VAKRSGNRLILSDAAAAGRAQAKQAAQLTEIEQATRRMLPLAGIQPRPGGDTRALRSNHVLSLAESIAAVGLVEPPTVDSHGHLLAGAHRLAALRLLAESNPDLRARLWLELCELNDATGLTAKQQADIQRLQQLPPLGTTEIPVMVMAFNAVRDSNRALAIETSENTQRRSYSRKEILVLVQRLREAGFVEREGRPREGEKALRPALSIILGKSSNTVRRWLGVLNDEPKTCPNGQVFPVQQAENQLLSAIRRYQRVASRHPEIVNEKVLARLEELEGLLDALSRES
jgi:ParB family chromosome partitioning protein